MHATRNDHCNLRQILWHLSCRSFPPCLLRTSVVIVSTDGKMMSFFRIYPYLFILLWILDCTTIVSARCILYTFHIPHYTSTGGPRGWNTLCLLSAPMRDLDQLSSTQTYRHCADMIDSLSWLVLEHFREYNQWPWQSFNPLEQQLAHHPSFVFAEILFVLLSGFAFLHAACESYAKEERRLLLIWVATFIEIGRAHV